MVAEEPGWLHGMLAVAGHRSATSFLCTPPPPLPHHPTPHPTPPLPALLFCCAHVVSTPLTCAFPIRAYG